MGFGGAGVAFGDELAVDGLEIGGARDELGPVRPLDLGAELEAEAPAELVVFGSKPADLVASDGQVGSKTGGSGGVVGRSGRGRQCEVVVGLATAGGFDVFANPVGVDEPAGHAGGFATEAKVIGAPAAARASMAARACWRLS